MNHSNSHHERSRRVNITIVAMLLCFNVAVDRATAQSSMSITNSTNDTLVHVKSNGNVGIGTTTPNVAGFDSAGNRVLTVKAPGTVGSGVLELVGNRSFDGDVGVLAFTNVGGGSSIAQINGFRSGAINAGALSFNTASAGSSIERIRVTSIGNVGIGTSTPTNLLEVRKDQDALTSVSVMNLSNGSGAFARLQVKTGTQANGAVFQMAQGTTNTEIWNFENGGFVFGTNDVARMRITNTGNIGIGTSTPSEKLEVAGNVRIGAATIRVGTGSPEGVVMGNVGDLYLRTDGGAGTTMYVKESGNATNTGWVGK